MLLHLRAGGVASLVVWAAVRIRGMTVGAQLSKVYICAWRRQGKERTLFQSGQGGTRDDIGCAKNVGGGVAIDELSFAPDQPNAKQLNLEGLPN